MMTCALMLRSRALDFFHWGTFAPVSEFNQCSVGSLILSYSEFARHSYFAVSLGRSRCQIWPSWTFRQHGGRDAMRERRS